MDKMMSQNGGRAVIIAPSALGSKDLPAGLSKVPLRACARRYIRRRRSVGGMRRRRIRGEVPDMTISRVPGAWLPETKSGRRKKFRHFSWACWSGNMVSTSHRKHFGRKLPPPS